MDDRARAAANLEKANQKLLRASGFAGCMASLYLIGIYTIIAAVVLAVLAVAGIAIFG